MRINVVIIFMLFCFSALSLFSQNAGNRYHSYGAANSRQFKVYFGPLVALSNVEGNFSVDAGATGGLIINQKIFIGIYAQTLVTKPPRTNLDTIGYPSFSGGEIKMKQAGVLLGYIHKPENEIHWGVSSSAGLGVLSLFAQDPSKQAKEMIYDDRVYIIIPKLFVEMNMTSWLKINASIGYRFVGKVNGIYINQAGEIIPTFYKSDYNKPEFSLALLFGTFGSHLRVLK